MRFAGALAFSKRAWLGVVVRSGLSLETRFVPAAPSPRRRGACLYLLRRGQFTVDGAPDLGFEGPASFALSEHHLEGASGTRSLTFSAGGSPWQGIEVHLAEEDIVTAVVRPPLERPVAIEVGDAVWATATRLLTHVEHGDDREIEAASSALLNALAETRIVSRDVSRASSEPLPFEKLWRAIGPLARRFALSPTVDELCKLADASPRQLNRYLDAFFEEFTVFGGGWRTVTRLLRLKLAILFLSAEDMTLAEVARTVGYGSVDAMARALRDGGAESPSFIRAALRAQAPMPVRGPPPQ